MTLFVTLCNLQEELKISHHADHSLNSFCKWQKRLNMKGDEHPVHHDVAILLTRHVYPSHVAL